MTSSDVRTVCLTLAFVAVMVGIGAWRDRGARRL